MDAKVAKKALDIYEGGACNERALARALVEAIDAANGADRYGMEWAPARLILAQLSHLMAHFATDGHGAYQLAGKPEFPGQQDRDFDHLKAMLETCAD